MKPEQLWSALTDFDGERPSAAQMLSRSSFDEEIEIDLRSHEYHILHHVTEKYCGNLSQGDFDRLYDFAQNHFVHPDDASDYAAMFDLTTLAERLESAPVQGLLAGYYRLLATDGSWVRTRQLVISGQELGLPSWIVRCYVYDIQRQWQRQNGDASPLPANEPKREEVTGLLDGIDYHRAVQARLEEMKEGWCLLFLEIDHHKLFTDWYGMDSGQYLLTQVSEVLRRVAAETGGMPGYMGEAVFCLTMPYDRARISALYDELQDLIASASAIQGFLPIFGIALIDGTCSDIREYFNHAALTAEEIRMDRHTRIRIYDAELHQKNSREYKLLYAFQRAIERGEICFWLQPQCRMPDQKIVGAEALVRWQRSDGTMEQPATFVPVLEKFGLITKLDTYVWESVCQWLRHWIDQGRTPVPLSVNVSQIDIFTLDVPKYFTHLLQKYNLSKQYLKIEITESACAEDTNTVRETVTRLRSSGFMVLMDDFGSGYSSLNMLRDLPIDVIKLDANFLRIQDDNRQKGVSILESVVNMTRSLSTPIIVEGVETREQVIFLTDLGCRYMQGYYFYRPMPVAQFETIIGDQRSIDTHGFVFQANQQIQVREFLDTNLFTDAMLNNILGAVAFYCWHDDEVEIIRYNQQFYQLVGIELEEFNDRKKSVQSYLHPGDREHMYDLLRRAQEHRIIGSQGVVRVYRPNGVLLWLQLKIYYIGEDEQGEKFYASAQDVTEQQFISSDLPGGYYRCLLEDEDYELLYVSQNFKNMLGFDEQELLDRFDNKLLNMVHPADVERLKQDGRAVARGERNSFHPYRILRKQGDYIYVADQSHITDRFGRPCWQSVIIDVTMMMHVRSQMRVLSAFLTDSILLLRREGETLLYEVVIHGLSKCLGLSDREFEESLNSGDFCHWVEGYRNIPHQEYTRLFIDSVCGSERELTVRLPGGQRIGLVARADRVDDRSNIEYIVILRRQDTPPREGQTQ